MSGISTIISKIKYLSPIISGSSFLLSNVMLQQSATKNKNEKQNNVRQGAAFAYIGGNTVLIGGPILGKIANNQSLTKNAVMGAIAINGAASIALIVSELMNKNKNGDSEPRPAGMLAGFSGIGISTSILSLMNGYNNNFLKGLKFLSISCFAILSILDAHMVINKGKLKASLTDEKIVDNNKRYSGYLKACGATILLFLSNKK